MYGVKVLSKSTLVPIPSTPRSNCELAEPCPIPSPKNGTNTVWYGSYPEAFWKSNGTSLPLGYCVTAPVFGLVSVYEIVLRGVFLTTKSCEFHSPGLIGLVSASNI